MGENIESKKLLDEIEKLIQSYVDNTKKENKTPTRDEIIEVVTDKLEDLLEKGSGNNEIIYIVSGMAIGIAIVLEIEETLKKDEELSTKKVT
jgi:lipoate-protein ligase A